MISRASVLIDLGAAAAGYLMGSIPFGLLLGQLRAGVDVRQHGSGGTGATNVLRTAGPAAAASTLVLDAAKGAVAVLLARWLGANILGQAAAGLAAVVGHAWPALVGFRGGKGVATSLGAALLLLPAAALAAALAWFGTLAIGRIVSLASLMGAATGLLLTVFMVIRGEPTALLVYAVGSFTVITVRHRGNLRRIRAGEEPTVSSLAARGSTT